jgi:hypothetical protein
LRLGSNTRSTWRFNAGIAPIHLGGFAEMLIASRAIFLPPQKIPEQLLLLASTERLGLG